MDRRVRKSRAAIFGAFEELLRQKSYTSITVGDIIETADVGRTTFYAHFQTKDALLDELCKDIFAHEIAPAPEKGHSFSSDSTEEQLLHVLCHLAEQRDRLAPLLASPSSHLFWEAIESQLVAFFGERIGASVQIKPGVQDELHAEHLGKTLCEVVRCGSLENLLSRKPRWRLSQPRKRLFAAVQGAVRTWNPILPLSRTPVCARRSSAA